MVVRRKDFYAQEAPEKVGSEALSFPQSSVTRNHPARKIAEFPDIPQVLVRGKRDEEEVYANDLEIRMVEIDIAKKGDYVRRKTLWRMFG